MSGNSFFTEGGPLGSESRVHKHNEEAFVKLLNHLDAKTGSANDKIRLEAFFDIMDEHGVYVSDAEVDAMVELTDQDGEVETTPIYDFARQADFWKLLTKKSRYDNEEILKKMSKTYDLAGRPKGPPLVTKIDTILKQINKVLKAFEALDKDKDGLVTKADFTRNFQSLTPHQIDCCFKKFDEDKDTFLNFVEFKNFMAKRKSLPDKALARCCSTLSLRSMSCLSLADSDGSGPPGYSTLSVAKPPSFQDIAEDAE